MNDSLISSSMRRGRILSRLFGEVIAPAAGGSATGLATTAKYTRREARNQLRGDRIKSIRVSSYGRQTRCAPGHHRRGRRSAVVRLADLLAPSDFVRLRVGRLAL